ncbi:helix-turn-helix domain-containing protein [Nocardioides acrostichi]|uniref:Helix-turn-helix domain-containing protein n=1 Tax=Nocardioides acrostichi TaxID=2784339 RepID=A0A930V0T6_9ACTN|nr:helix-turn-helix domain-containing protein [Nocardioides acrostichi]MBF4162595.1 helix-turn-helix domain-containing protein [Nocardioides acrostichi]
MTATRGARNPKFVWQDAFIERGPSANAGYLGLVMSTYDNGDGKDFFVSQEQLANRTKLSERTVFTHLKALVHDGWVEVLEKGGRAGAYSKATTYRLRIPTGGLAEESDTARRGAESHGGDVARPVTGMAGKDEQSEQPERSRVEVPAVATGEGRRSLASVSEARARRAAEREEHRSARTTLSRWA